MKVIFILLISLNLFSIEIIDRPIDFDETRIELTKEYILKRYKLQVQEISITPQIIVIHWTAINDFKESFNRFVEPRLPKDRAQIQKASILNVSTHFMIDRDGSIYRLMDEKTMARHVIGLNYNSIGIENVGGKGNIDNLTPEQLKANIELIAYLLDKYPNIDHLIGHHEYTQCTENTLWLEKDKDYRTKKFDPGVDFMQNLRIHFPKLKRCQKASN